MNKNNIAVSVIITVYNTDKYITDAINSVIGQSFQDFEIIAINDGSTDSSLEKLEQLDRVDKRIKVINQSKKGPSAARNSGYNNAKGEYIVFLDSDDLLESNALALCYNACIENNLDFCTFDAKAFIDEGGFASPFLNYDRTKTLCAEVVYQGNMMFKALVDKMEYTPSCCLLMIKREFYQQNNLSFYEGILHEDQLFTTTLYMKSKRTQYLPSFLYKRRFRSNSIMTSKFSWYNVDSYLTVCREIKVLQQQIDIESSRVIDVYLSQMLNAVVYNAYVLPFKERIKLFGITTFGSYRKYVNTRSRAVLLFKKLASRNKRIV